MLRAAVAEGVAPGLIAVATSAGGPIHQCALGCRSLSGDAPMTDDTVFWIDPAAGVGGVLMTQILPFADAAVLDLFARYEAAINDALR